MKNIILANNISVKGKEVNAASKTLEGYIPIFDAEIVKRLKNNGYNIEFKNLNSEFAILNDSYKDILKELRSDKYIVALSSENGYNALLTKDGNIEEEKELIILKPSFGLISKYGIFSYAPSIDNLTIFSKDINYLSEILEKISGRDDKDFLTGHKFKYKPLKKEGLKYKEVSNLNELEINEEILDISKNILEILSNAEATTTFAAIDGIRYGKREKGNSYDEIIINSRSNFSYEIKRNLLFGSYVLRKNRLEEIYFKAMKIRRLIKEEIDKILEKENAIIFSDERLIAMAILSGNPVIAIKKELENKNETQNKTETKYILGKMYKENELINLLKLINKEEKDV